MKSFVSTLLQNSSAPDERKSTSLRYDDEPDNYVAALDREDMTTVEIADMFGVSITHAMKRLCRLEGDLRVRRVGSEQSGGQRETILWGTAPVPNDVFAMTYCDHVARALIKGSVNTRVLASRLNINYYSALAACKQLELAGVVRRDGVDRSRPKQPHIIWKLK